MKKRILVFSVDAMVCEDVQALRDMPNFQKYLAGGCEVTGGMRTIYPSVTYPIHVSMMTGCYPGTHGVVSNFGFTTENKDASWNWNKCYSVEDIFSAAKKAGYTTASISWPVTGNNKDIDYLVNEYWMPEPGDTLRSSFARMGTSEEVLEILEQNICHLPNGYEKGGKKNFMQWPQIDEFWVNVACDVIKKRAPEVMFLHTGTFDSYRHSYGVFSDHLQEARENLDRHIGMLMAACAEAGVLEETNLVLVSDHGQRDICRAVHINVFLADRGFIQTDASGNVTEWKAYCMSNAMSTLVYLNNPQDEALEKDVYDCLKHLKDEGVYGIGRIFTAREAREEEHLWGEFSFVIESDGYTSFGDRAVRPLVQNFDISDYRFGRATHGYIPDLGPQPVFVAKGPDFRENVAIDRASIVDEAPTYARILGVELPADGEPLEAFLK